MVRGIPAVALLAAAAFLSAVPPAAAGDETKSSAHYVWNIHGDCPEAPELMKVAEAAWSQFSAHFGARPAGKLEIEYFEKSTDYSYALTAKGAEAAGGVPAGGRYWSENRKVYQPRMGRSWETRQSLILNLADQFLALGVLAKNKPIPTWYHAGITFHFALHRWDGKTLVTGVDDEPSAVGRALAQFAADAKEGKWDPMDAVNSDSKMYIEAWTAVHFLLSGADKNATARFKALERKMWEGMEARESATILLGADPKKIRKSARDWIVALPRPWVPVADIWERTGEDSFSAEPFNKGQAAILLREADPGPAPFIEATITPAEKGEGGLMIGFTEAVGGLVVAWSPAAKIELLRIAGPGRGQVLASADGPTGAEAKLRVEVAGSTVKVLLAGKEVLSWTDEGGASPGAGKIGLLCDGGKVRFTGVKTSEAKPAKK